jgi:hypothetical protein
MSSEWKVSGFGQRYEMWTGTHDGPQQYHGSFHVPYRNPYVDTDPSRHEYRWMSSSHLDEKVQPREIQPIGTDGQPSNTTFQESYDRLMARLRADGIVPSAIAADREEPVVTDESEKGSPLPVASHVSDYPEEGPLLGYLTEQLRPTDADVQSDEVNVAASLSAEASLTPLEREVLGRVVVRHQAEELLTDLTQADVQSDGEGSAGESLPAGSAGRWTLDSICIIL